MVVVALSLALATAGCGTGRSEADGEPSSSPQRSPTATVHEGGRADAGDTPSPSPSRSRKARREGRGDADDRPSPSRSQIFIATVMKKGQAWNVPNPGSGPGDPRLTSALLKEFPPARESQMLPAGVVALPVIDRASLFMPMRMISSSMVGPRACDKWTVGLGNTVVQDFNHKGVQIGLNLLETLETPKGGVLTRQPDAERMFDSLREDAERGRHKLSRKASPEDRLTFGETIITGPTEMLNSLVDTSEMPSCGHLTGDDDEKGAIEPFPVPSLGAQAFAFRVTGSREPVGQWVEVVRTPRYLIELRIPARSPAPRTDPAELLPQIAQAAYSRAEEALR